ncbi:exodeoxyribonuclease V subunit beta [Oceaniserpentilla sp. 4NH20-0058]|uniref:exodeoxyribonuclease V subunit beta n=1 Tax=Oceaniserpentilla sp. 4NH20-0058 TaxID=3127660 RepID=UPI00310534D6
MSDSQGLTMQPLHVARVPLSGISLIEASAGTGKTYTITGLYLRLVLGHGCEPLSPENILVVTFTRAATEELRNRIRTRLRQAYMALSDQAEDDLISEIKAKLGDTEQAKQRLKDAQQLMDLAAIYTIHGFAQRLLRQNSVETGLNGEFELILDESPLLEQAIHDVWRNEVYPLTGAELQLILGQWPSPDVLLQSLRPLIYKQVRFHLGEPQGEITHCQQMVSDALHDFLEPWQMHGQNFVQDLKSHPKANGTFVKGLDKKVANIEAYVNGKLKLKTSDVISAFQSLSPNGLLKSVKKGGEPIEHELSLKCETLANVLEAFEQAKVFAVREKRVSLLNVLRERLQQLKQQKQILSTDDLLSQVNVSLQGANQQRLIQHIRQQYPVAMVDEFQDTDHDQYQVFYQVYSSTLLELEKQHALFMIGDPKQAIYKFRGADIFTYIQAKQQVDAQYTLDTNYRSSKDMVEAINHMFTQHDHPFIYDKSIPFLKVKANNTAPALVLEHKPEPALTWVHVKAEQFDSKPSLNAMCAESCAEKISVLLNHSQQNQATLKQQPVSAGDMAVLVRNRMQAALVKISLAKRGISCVYVGQESVYDGDEAMALLMLLQAVHELSERQFRNAIAYPTWSLTLADLTHLNLDESAWEGQLEQLYKCYDIWSQQGIMAMLMYWLHTRGLPQIWLSELEGERRLTNVMHLAEILQHSSTQVQGMQGLITWLTHQITQADGDAEQKQLRLESDANLVQIVTIHKSKGLEYPIVFLPFNWDGKESKDELFFDEATQSNVCDLVGDFQLQRIQEGLAEEVRLLYVGLTRAASKCYVTMPEVSGTKRLDESVKSSALSHVLFSEALADEPKLAKIEALKTALPESFNIEPASDEVTLFQIQDSQASLVVREFTGHIKQQWQMSSFSSLVRNLHVAHTPRFEMDDDAYAQATPIDRTELAGQFLFPRGAHAGNFLHTLLEEIDFSDVPDDVDTLIESLLARFGIDLEHQPLVKPWLDIILTSPMAQHEGEPLCLGDLTPDLKKVEMEFYFPVEKLNAEDFNALLGQYPCVDVSGASLNFNQLKGMLKGFIDLTFEWGNQYFILDYKSNHLGDELSDYQTPSLHSAMAEHRYDVQLVIYTLALHRLLSLRIQEYDYDAHIGGGYYLFLRGLDIQNSQSGQFYCKPEKSLILALDALLKGETLEQALLIAQSEASPLSVPSQGSLL